jgi:hypothetical protein
LIISVLCGDGNCLIIRDLQAFFVLFGVFH